MISIKSYSSIEETIDNDIKYEKSVKKLFHLNNLEKYRLNDKIVLLNFFIYNIAFSPRDSLFLGSEAVSSLK